MNKNKVVGYQARAFKSSYKNTQSGVQQQEFYDDIKFSKHADKVVHKFEQKQKITDLKDQMDYFGYEIEPFHMKNERGVGKIDDTGYFVFDKERDKKINDAWLDSLDKDNQFDKMRAEQKVSRNKIADIDMRVDGFEKEKNRRFCNIEIGQQFFQSKKFQSREDAEQYYRKLDEQEDFQINSDEESAEIEEDKPQKRLPIQKKKEDQNKPDLSVFDSYQLKQILFDLLEPNESANHAMKRFKEIFSKQSKVYQFKKNQRKKQKIEQENNQQEKNHDIIQEAQQTFNIILELCHNILLKTNDPTIYEQKKEDLLQNSQQQDENEISKQDLNEKQQIRQQDIPIKNMIPPKYIPPEVDVENIYPKEMSTKFQEGVVYDEQDEDNIF